MWHGNFEISTLNWGHFVKAHINFLKEKKENRSNKIISSLFLSLHLTVPLSSTVTVRRSFILLSVVLNTTFPSLSFSLSLSAVTVFLSLLFLDDDEILEKKIT